MKSKSELEQAEIAEILGAFIGDGWIEKRGVALYICGSPIEDKEYYNTYLGLLFSKHFIPVTPKLFRYWKVYGIGCYRREIIRKALKIGFEAGEKAKSARIHEWIMKSGNKEVMKGVLRGIFDADGSFYCKKKYGKYDSEWSKKFHCQPRIVISVISKTLIQQVSELLNRLKIRHRVSHTKPYTSGSRNYSAMHRIWIDRLESIEQWFTIVGSSNPRHQTRYELWQRLGYLPPRTSIYERKMLLKLINSQPPITNDL